MQIQQGFRGVFMDLSKAFDKFWHDDLMHKVKRLGIYGKILRVNTFISK